MDKIGNNITKLYLIKISKWFMLTQPILMLYFKDTGLTTEESFRLKAVYSVAIVLLELPSGYFADLFGRKRTLIIGAICGVLGFSFYSMGHGFWFFLAAEITLGIGQSFISGADSAMLYDTLQATKNEKKYTLYEGRTTAIGNFSESMAAILGGLLAQISLSLPFLVQTGVAFIAVPAAFLLVEPAINRVTSTAGWKDMGRILKTIYTHRKLRSAVLFSSITGLATLTMAWVIQLYLEEGLSFSYVAIGATTAAFNLIVALFSVLAYRLSNTTQPRHLQLAIALLIPAGFIITGLSGAITAMIVLTFFHMLRGVATPVLKDYINTHTHPGDRATVLSVRSLLIRLVFAVAGPLCGWLIDAYSYRTMFLAMGVMILALNLWLVIPGIISRGGNDT
jgi:MFS family permease